jgi:predicted N-acetyltransferase YhbS
MRWSNVSVGHEPTIIALVTAAFADAEGAAEGALVGGLVRHQLTGTSPADIHVFTAIAHDMLAGVAVFTRLCYADDPRVVFILSPMAVATRRQRQGIGQGLLRHALAELRVAGADGVMTYGDPACYGRVGFTPVSDAVVPAPLPLSQPVGWIGRSLTGHPLTQVRGPATCVVALRDPRFW